MKILGTVGEDWSFFRPVSMIALSLATVVSSLVCSFHILLVPFCTPTQFLFYTCITLSFDTDDRNLARGGDFVMDAVLSTLQVFLVSFELRITEPIKIWMHWRELDLLRFVIPFFLSGLLCSAMNDSIVGLENEFKYDF
jgi:hypothetical protein